MEECSVDLKRIMVALDLSDYSDNTFAHAMAFARALNTEMVILNVINSRGLDQLTKLEAEGFAVTRDKFLETAIAERTSVFEEKYLAAAEDIATRLVFRVGLPYQEIVEAVKDEDIDLLVMGPKGHNAFTGGMLGTSAEKVFRRATCPVISVRGPDHCRPPQ